MNIFSGYRISLDRKWHGITCFINLDNMVAIYQSHNGNYWVAVDANDNEWGIESKHNEIIEMIAREGMRS